MKILAKALKSITGSVYDARNSKRALDHYCHRLDLTDRLLALKDEFDRKGLHFVAE